MKYFVHRLCNGARNRGLFCLVREDNKHYKTFVGHTPDNTLYSYVGDNISEVLTQGEDIHETRAYSSASNLNITFVKRLLGIRNDWSKK